MTPAEVIGVSVGLLGLFGAFAAWVISTFQTKDSAAIQEKAITEIVGGAVSQIKAETAILRSVIEPIRDDIQELKKKFDSHMNFHAGA